MIKVCFKKETLTSVYSSISHNSQELEELEYLLWMNGEDKCSIYIEWNITHPLERRKSDTCHNIDGT
jgi:hypothetical protein